jgi:lipid II:glycine glycyltransferase (peptidoglycan interpeptide bridge formation enzyme)
MYKQRDINGDIIEDGFNNEKVVDSLKVLGFKHDGFITHYDVTKQVRWSFELSLEEKDENTLLKEMNGNTRRSIQKAEHLQVKVRTLSREEIPIFKEICDKTSERRHFRERPLEYYYKMYDLFNPTQEIEYVIAEVDLKDTLKVLDDDLEKLQESKQRAIEHNKAGQIKEFTSQIEDLNKRIKEIEGIIESNGNHLYLATAMYMLYGDEVMYYHAGGYKEYMSFFGQYLIQWEMIKKALRLQKKIYNFYGIKGNFDKNDPDYGVYLFKKGFNGNVIEYIGDFYLPISWYYYLQKIRKKMKK